MYRVVVIQFITLDGVTQDPDGAEGTPTGGWAFRSGPQAVAGDKFKLGELMDTGTMLLGRRTWEKFARIWPARSDEFSTKMNRMRKLVASTSLQRVDTWANSELLHGDFVDQVRTRKADRDLIVAGSDSLVRLLIEEDLVDEYRLLTFPIVVGEGRRLFREGTPPVDLRLVDVERSGEAVLVTYRREPSAAAEKKHAGAVDSQESRSTSHERI
jgi:dihydrofolate reductase